MTRFVQDGHQRAINGIRAEVQKKYEKKLQAVTVDQRKVLKKTIEAEIRQMIQRSAPPSAHY